MQSVVVNGHHCWAFWHWHCVILPFCPFTLMASNSNSLLFPKPVIYVKIVKNLCSDHCRTTKKKNNNFSNGSVISDDVNIFWTTISMNSEYFVIRYMVYSVQHIRIKPKNDGHLFIRPQRNIRFTVVLHCQRTEEVLKGITDRIVYRSISSENGPYP